MLTGTLELLTTTKIFVVFFALLLTSCLPKQQRYVFSHPTMGTETKIIFYTFLPQKKVNLIRKQLKNTLDKLNKTFSHYLPKSEVIKLCEHGYKNTIKVNSHLLKILTISQKIYRQTNHYFDPTLPNPPTTFLRKKFGNLKKGFHHININQKESSVYFTAPVFLDFGAIAKGYTCDVVMNILMSYKILIASIDIGGEIALSNPPPQKKGWKVSLTDNNLKKIDSLLLANCSLSTSGDFFHRKKHQKSHILSLNQKYSQLSDSVTVITSSTAQADALATAFKAMGLDKTKFFFQTHNPKNIKVIFVHNNQVIYFPENLKK